MYLKAALLTCAWSLIGCGLDSKKRSEASNAPLPSLPSVSSEAASAKLPAPTRLTSLGVAAYDASLALDDDAVYLMTGNAAFRLVAGEPAYGRELELGVGPALTRTAFVFWAAGAIWSAPKHGGGARELARFPHRPQYFVTSGEALAWIDQSEAGAYAIYTLDARTPRVLVSSPTELRSLAMLGETVYFVERPAPGAWRIGAARLDGAPLSHGATQRGRPPSQLSGVDDLYYYDLDRSRIVRLSADLRHEEALLTGVVCSPLHVSDRIYCGCVDGLFEVSLATRRARVLAPDRQGSITNVVSRPGRVAWTVDLGPNQLAVDSLAREPLP